MESMWCALTLNSTGQTLGGTRVTGFDAGRMDVRETAVAAQGWMSPASVWREAGCMRELQRGNCYVGLPAQGC